MGTRMSAMIDTSDPNYNPDDSHGRIFRCAFSYCNWAGIIGYGWEFAMLIVFGLMFLRIIFSNVAWLVLICLSFFINLILLFITWFHTGPAVNSQLISAELPEPSFRGPVVNRGQLDYMRKVTRDAMFHNDEWHFKVATGGYFGLILVAAIFFGANGFYQFDFPFVYSPDALANAVLQLVIYFASALVPAALFLICLMETHTCFIRTHLNSINRMVGGENGIPVRDEMGEGAHTQPVAGSNVMNRLDKLHNHI
jgi:hypothetical protein